MKNQNFVEVSRSRLNEEILLPENSILLASIKQYTSQTSWSTRNMNDQSWEKCFRLMKSTTAETINFTKYNHPSVIKDISHIAFRQLKNLYLYENRIISIEAFILIDAPLLELRFGDNLIIQMRSLRKAKFPFIRDLRFHRNRICTLDFLTEIMSHQTVQELTFQSLPKDPLHSDSLQALFKMEATKMSEIECYSSQRVSWANIKSMIFNKFIKTMINGKSK